MKKRWPRLIVLVLSAIFGICLLSFLLLLTPPAKTIAFNKLCNYLRSRSGIELSVSGYRLDFLKGEVNLENPVIRSASKPDMPPIFKADRIYINVSVIEALRKNWVIEELDLNAPEIHYFSEKDGQTNLPGASSAPGSAPKLLIIDGNATDGSIQVQDLRQDLSILIPKWHLSINGSRTPFAHHIAFACEGDSGFKYKEINVPVHFLEFSGTFQGASLKIDQARMEAAGSKLSVSGSLDSLSSPIIDLKFTPDIDLGRISSVGNLKETIQGSLSGEIVASGGRQNTQIEAQLKGTDVSARNYAKTNLDLKIQAVWNRDSGKLTVRDFDLASPEGKIRGEAELFTKPGEELQFVKADIRDLNLFPIWRETKLHFDLATRSSGRISLQWKGAFSPSKLNGSAHLRLAATRSSPDHNLLPISGILDAQIQPDRIRGKLQALKAFATEVNGRFSMRSFRSIEGDFHGDAQSLHILTEQVSRFVGGPDEVVPVKIDGPVRLDFQASGELKQPTIVAAVSSPALQLGEMKNLRANAEATVRGSRVDFSNTLTLPQDSTVSIGGSFEFRAPKTQMNLDLHTDGISVAALRSIFNSEAQILGNVRASLHLSGAMDNLNGYGSIEGEDLSLYGEPMGHLETDLQMTGSEIQSTRFKLERNPQNAETDYLDAWFRYALDSGGFQFRAEGKDLTLRQMELPRMGSIQGAINLAASGEGTTRDPYIDLKLESNTLQVRRHPVGPISVSGALSNGQIKIDAQAPDMGVSSTATVAAQAPYLFSVKLLAKESDLSRLGLKGVQDQPLSGIVEGSLDGSGNLEDPGRAHLSADVQKLQLQTGELGIHARDPFHMEYRDHVISFISAATIVSGNSLLEITGGLPIGNSAPPNTLHLNGQIDLSQATGFFPAPRGLLAVGILNLDIALTGTPQELSSSGTILLNGGVIKIPKIPAPLTEVNLRASIQEGSLIVQQANALWGEGRIGLTGELPFGLLPQNTPLKFAAKEGSARFVLDAANLKPEETGLLPEQIKGVISLHITGRTAGMGLDALSAQADFQELNLQVGDIAFRQKTASSISVRNGIASILRLSLIGPRTNFEMSGSAGLYPDGPLNLKLTGDLDSALLTFGAKNLKLAGGLKVQAEIAGTRNAPTLTGFAEMNGGRVSLRSPRVVADSLRVRMDLSSDQITVRECSGTLNGGSIDLRGTVGYRSGDLTDFNLKAELQDVFLNFPEGLKSASSGNLTILSSEDTIVVGGNIRVLESSYREPLEVGGRLMDYLKAQQVLEIGEERNAFLERIRLDIAIRTITPVLVKNNVAELEASANLRIVGSYYDPSMTGRITLDQGGEIILNQQTYYIDRGSITLADQTHIEPDLNIQAQTRAGNYDITLQLTGTPNRLTTTLSSPSGLSEPDILSLLLTGRTLSETQGDETQMVRTQALSLIAGQAGEEVAREARQLLHVSTFRIDPGLVASESDPGARLTVGQDITKDFSLAYSMNLTNGGDQIWIAQYDFARSLSTQATRQQDNSLRFEVRHNLRFGGPPRRRRSGSAATKFEIGSIQVQGEEPFSEKTVLDQLKLKTGDKYDFQKIQKGLDRLQGYYVDQKRLEANMRLHRETQESLVNLSLNIESGPMVDFTYDGTNIPGSLRERVEKAWENGVFETERLEDSIMVIRRTLIKAGFLQSEVTYKMETENDRKRVHFHVAPGPRYTKVPVVFHGASGIGADELKSVLDQADLQVDIYANPEKVVEYIDRYYREHGYLQAKVSAPQLNLNPETGSGQVSIDILEGPLFLIGDLEFSGNQAFDYDQLWSVIPTSSGSFYDPNTLRDAVKALENLYRSEGYNDATITFRVIQDSETAHANLTFRITERKQSIIRDIRIEGTLGTSQDFVRRQLDFETGDALDFRKIDVTRRRLYATGVYTSVDFQTEEIPFSDAGPQEKSLLVRLRLRETQPYSVQYGVFYDTDRGPGGILEVQNSNFLGSASNLGMRLRYDSNLKEARLFFNQPFVTKIHMKMNFSAFFQKETREAFDARRIGFSIFRERNLPREFRFDYGYRYDHVRWSGVPDNPTLYQSDTPVGRLVFTLARDTRDSFLDATRGEFASHSLEIGPHFFGSETGFARYFGQYFRYVPLDKLLGRPQKDAEGKRIPPRIFYAGALRLGVTGAFSGGDLISPERFFAGGGTTMRGFEQDRLGPTYPETGAPKGGEGLFLFNNEIRFPIVSVFQGVTFLDLGNVYEKLSDFNFTMRKSAGIGLRIKIKYVPIRFDYGWKLDRLRPGESAGAFFFSIGQAF